MIDPAASASTTTGTPACRYCPSTFGIIVTGEVGGEEGGRGREAEVEEVESGVPSEGEEEEEEGDRKSTRLNSSHITLSRMPSSA